MRISSRLHGKLTGAVMMALVFSGCAGINVIPVKWDEQPGLNAATHGYRYYMSTPYIMVTRVQSTAKAIVPVGKPLSVDSQSPPQLIGRTSLPPSARFDVALSDNPVLTFVSSAGADTNSLNSIAAADPAGSLMLPFRRRGSSTDFKPIQLTIRRSDDKSPLLSGVLTVSAQDATKLAVSLEATSVSDVIKDENSYKTEIIYLPNPDRVMAVEPVSRLGGTNEISLKFKDGWMLTESNSKSDTQTDETIAASSSFVTALAGAIATVAPVLAPASSGRDTKDAESKDLSGLYRPVFKNGYIQNFQRVNLTDNNSIQE